MNKYYHNNFSEIKQNRERGGSVVQNQFYLLLYMDVKLGLLHLKRIKHLRVLRKCLALTEGTDEARSFILCTI
jgi:hypothetical protein